MRTLRALARIQPWCVMVTLCVIERAHGLRPGTTRALSCEDATCSRVQGRCEAKRVPPGRSKGGVHKSGGRDHLEGHADVAVTPVACSIWGPESVSSSVTTGPGLRLTAEHPSGAPSSERHASRGVLLKRRLTVTSAGHRRRAPGGWPTGNGVLGPWAAVLGNHTGGVLKASGQRSPTELALQLRHSTSLGLTRAWGSGSP